MAERRTERVAALLRREVAEFIERRVKNPDIGFVTVTSVRLSEDLKHAKILVVCRGDDEEKERSLRILNGCTPAIRRDLKKALRLRFIPNLVFRPDTAFDHADRIRRLLDEVRNEENA